MILPFICEPCRADNHLLCAGGSWCTCQHRTKKAGHATHTQ